MLLKKMWFKGQRNGWDKKSKLSLVQRRLKI